MLILRDFFKSVESRTVFLKKGLNGLKGEQIYALKDSLQIILSLSYSFLLKSYKSYAFYLVAGYHLEAVSGLQREVASLHQKGEIA